MFDIGFPELILISVVALLVIGPEKLPETVRSISLWIGRVQRTFSRLRREIESEIGADEIRAQLHNEKILEDIEESKKAIKAVHDDVKNTIQEAKTAVSAAEETAVSATALSEAEKTALSEEQQETALSEEQQEEAVSDETALSDKKTTSG